MNNIVKFNSHELEIVSYNNEYCFQSQQIVDALELDSRQTLNNIFNRHKEEFEGFTYLPVKGRPRLFNREGAWLIGMFARTPKAAEFRKWVLKVLGAVADKLSPTDKPVLVAEHMRALPSGKKEIVLSEKAKTEIGGIVKAVVSNSLEEKLSTTAVDNILQENMLIFDKKNNISPDELREIVNHCYWHITQLPVSVSQKRWEKLFFFFRSYLTRFYDVSNDILLAADLEKEDTKFRERITKYHKYLLHNTLIEYAAE